MKNIFPIVFPSISFVGNDWQWIQTHRHCGRRGIWIKPELNSERQYQKLEVCGGREGDDMYVSLSVGDVITPEILRTITSLFSYPRDAREANL